MAADIFECTSCGRILDPRKAVGMWIECPNCKARYLIDDLPQSVGAGRADTSEMTVTGLRQLKTYYFPLPCDYEAFRMKCFDIMMRESPADIFSELNILEEKQSYLPYVASIGGDPSSSYTALYVGEDTHGKISGRYAKISFGNSDQHFGSLARSSAKKDGSLAIIPVNPDSLSSLPSWATHADEVHYYPFYSLECSYGDKAFAFSSFGNSESIMTGGMPVDQDIHRRPRLIALSGDDEMLFTKAGATAILIILAICLAFIYRNEIIGFCVYVKEFASYHWPIMLRNSSWFAYVIAFIAICFCLIVGLLIAGLASGIAFGAAFCLSWVALKACVFQMNKHTMKVFLKRRKAIQLKKKTDAYSRFSVSLHELYDKESDLKPN